MDDGVGTPSVGSTPILRAARAGVKRGRCGRGAWCRRGVTGQRASADRDALLNLAAVASAALRLVQRRVGAPRHALDVVVLHDELADADAARAPHFPLRRVDDEPVTGLADAFGHPLRR